MYPSSESACSCSTEGSVSHCSVLMSTTGGAREDMHVYKGNNKLRHTCVSNAPYTHTNTHTPTDHKKNSLSQDFPQNFMHFIEVNCLDIGGFYTKDRLYFIYIFILWLEAYPH